MKNSVEKFTEFLAGLPEPERAYYQAFLDAVELEIKKRAAQRGTRIQFGADSALDLVYVIFSWWSRQATPREVKNG